MNTSDILKGISVLQFTKLQAYLRLTGWNRVETGKETIALFQKETGNDWHEAILPLNKDFKDYNARIYDVLDTVSKAESRPVDQVLSDILIDPADVIRFRVNNRDTASGTISFLEGFDLLESAKKALYVTACDIIQPEVYHKRLGFKAAQQFIEECRLGQTERRSFAASIICPFINQTDDEEPQQLTLFNDEAEIRSSFTRQITKRLMTTLTTVKRAIDTGRETEITQIEGPEIISANFLESIVELNSSRFDSELEISSSWSPFAQEAVEPVQSIRFTNDYNSVLTTLINRMRPANDGILDTFIGKISQTKANPDIFSRDTGEVVLNYVIGDEEKVSRAKVILDADDYTAACTAHQEGRTVKITGTLVSYGRTKVIQNPALEIL